MEGLRQCDIIFSRTFVGSHFGLWGGQANLEQDRLLSNKFVILHIAKYAN